MTLFKIGNTDFTQFVYDRKYQMAKREIYTEWVDGNFTLRRAFQRKQVVGAFTMSFYSQAEFNAFISAFNSAKTADGYCAISVFLDDEKTNVDINAFLEIEVKTAWTNTGGPDVSGVKVSVTER